MTKTETDKTVMKGSFYYCTKTFEQVFFDDINELCSAVENYLVVQNRFIQFLPKERQVETILNDMLAYSLAKLDKKDAERREYWNSDAGKESAAMRIQQWDEELADKENEQGE